MNTIEELEYYCNEKSPVGALMLVGEWGCGKTYLLENELAEKLKETHILVRVSLFGIDSIRELNQAVKRQWALKCGPSYLGKLNSKKRTMTAGKTVFNAALSVIPVAKDLKGAVLAINPYDYIGIQPTVKKDEKIKRVILIFDDLERSKINKTDVLGCINEYCENLRFNTIIVANEDELEKRSGNDPKEISYREIKEKIITRTIKHKPDIEQILNSLINSTVTALMKCHQIAQIK